MAGKGIDDLPWPKRRHRIDRKDPPPGKARFDEIAAKRREEKLRRKALRAALRAYVKRPQNIARARSLIRRLNGSGRHPTMASPVWMRDMRIRATGALAELVEGETDGSVRMLTMIPRKWQRRRLLQFDCPRELWTVRSAANRERDALRRENAKNGIPNNPNPGWLICFIDGEWDTHYGCYSLHLHGVAAGEWVDVVDSLRSRTKFRSERGKDGEVWARILVAEKAPTDIFYALSYRLKSYWLSVHYYLNAKGKLRRSKHRRRLPHPHNTHVLFWLDKWRVQDITLMMGLRVTKKGLVRTVLSNSTYTND